MKAYAILWDIDLEEGETYEEMVEKLNLPEEIEISKELEYADEDEIGDYISDLTGFCHCGFKIKR